MFFFSSFRLYCRLFSTIVLLIIACKVASLFVWTISFFITFFSSLYNCAVKVESFHSISAAIDWNAATYLNADSDCLISYSCRSMIRFASMFSYILCIACSKLKKSSKTLLISSSWSSDLFFKWFLINDLNHLKTSFLKYENANNILSWDELSFLCALT